jgi:hypothetical protein
MFLAADAMVVDGVAGNGALVDDLADDDMSVGGLADFCVAGDGWLGVACFESSWRRSIPPS